MAVDPESSPCVFCRLDATKTIAENALSFAVRDVRPATALHSLILPRRHVASFFDLDEDEAQAIERLVCELRRGILAEDSSVEGFNIGINVGEVAGQTIFHCHIISFRGAAATSLIHAVE
jgi:ATP adenylyltransferase